MEENNKKDAIKKSDGYVVTELAFEMLCGIGTRRVVKNVFKVFGGSVAGPFAPVVNLAIDVGAIGMGSAAARIAAKEIERKFDGAVDIMLAIQGFGDTIKSVEPQVE